MLLPLYLKKTGLVTGPLAKNTSHSGLLDLRRQLLGLPKPPETKPEHQNFGNALHEQFLENGKKTFMVIPEEQKLIDAMIKALWAHPLVKNLMADSVREEKLYKEFQGVLLAYILDINCKKRKIGADLKSTVCRTLAQFIEKAFEYGYINQGFTYKEIEKLKMFFFIGVSKEKKPKVFILNLADHKEELEYAKNEVEFLLYFYSGYGKLIEK